MNQAIMTMFSDAEGRYLASEEIDQISDYVASLDRRIAAMQAVQAAEQRILDDALERTFQQLPKTKSYGGEFRDKASRDVGLVLRYCTMAMVRDDEKLLKDKLLYWLRTILQSFFSRKYMDVTYRELASSCERHLDQAHVQLLAPYLKLTHEILTRKR